VTPSDTFRANRLAWRFKKSGQNGDFLMAIADLDANVRDTLLRLAQLQDLEVAAVGLFRSERDWVLITSRRILWKRDEDTGTIALSALSDATIDARDLKTAGRKDRVDTLTVVTTSGDRHHLVLECGPPLSGAWNALKMAAHWNNDTHSR
jgi:hypothetical protein